MPVKRRIPKLREIKITREAIAAFVEGDSAGLHRALGLKPWEWNPLYAGEQEPPARMSEGEAPRWLKARGLFLALEKAAR